MENPDYDTEQDQEKSPANASAGEPSSNDSYEELCSRLAQKDRDLVLAAELGKALLESNQELQRRYGIMSETCSAKLEALQQEKYNLHLEVEKSETEHQNKLKDLQDDINSLREQLRIATQHQQDNEADTSRALIEAKQKSDYLVEQVQQASKKEEDLKQELQDEKAKNETHACVILDHLEHITMLREQVEYLSEKLREASEALLEIQNERDQLFRMKHEERQKHISLEDTIEQHEETIKNQEEIIKQLEAQMVTKAKNGSVQTGKQHQQQQHGTKNHSAGMAQQSRSRVRAAKCQQQLQQPLCYSEAIRSSLELVSSSMIVAGDEDTTDSATEMFSQSMSREFAGDEKLVHGSPQESLLSEFSTTPHHCRTKSDCSVISISEGSRKRHHKTMAGDSDDETESSDKSSKSSVCKQTLYSESGGGGGGSFIPPSSSSKPCVVQSNLPVDYDNRFHQSISSPRSDFLTPPPEPLNNTCRRMDSSSLHSTYSVSSSPLTPPEDEDVEEEEESGEDFAQFSDKLTHDQWRCHSPVNQGTSLFEELSSKLSDLNRQDSETSEKSLFDELSHQMTRGHDDGDNTNATGRRMSSCLLGHHAFHNQVDGHDSYGYNARRSEDESSYTCEWPLLTSVSADMLDGDDFECDDDDFLVGNVAGSTLSIGDSGVGIMLTPFSRKTEPLDVDEQSGKSHSPQAWGGRMDKEGSNKQELQEACRLMRDLVDRLQGESEAMADLTSPESETAQYSMGQENESSFDHLFSLIRKARQFVDDRDHGGVSHLRKFSARQWQMEATEDPAMEELKAPSMDYKRLPHWSKATEVKKSNSSSSLFLRRSL